MKSQAQQKRERIAKESLTHRLNRILIDFKNTYFKTYCEWNMKMMELKNHKAEVKIDFIKQNIGKLQNPDRPVFGNWNQSDVDRQISYHAALVEAFNRTSLHHYDFLAEANRSYNSKLEGLIDKLIEANLVERLTVKHINNISGAFEFLVSGKDKECHARVIFANGEIKAPHYRFITTIRKTTA